MAGEESCRCCTYAGKGGEGKQGTQNRGAHLRMAVPLAAQAAAAVLEQVEAGETGVQ